MKDINWDNRPKRMVTDRDPWLPFPGIYPTRWAIKMRWGLNQKSGLTHQWRYIGKPNSRVAWFVREKMQTRRYCRINASEFVRNGVILRAFSTIPRTQLTPDNWNQAKNHLVDPWIGYPHGWMITHWADHGMRPLPVTYKGHRFVVYSSSTAPTQSRLREYKQWLDTANIAFSKQ